MRYLCLIHLNEQQMAEMPATDLNVLNAGHLDFNDALRAQGRFLLAEALEPANTTACVQVRNGKRHITDGPFTESKEVAALGIDGRPSGRLVVCSAQ
jgi:hypothetical protein